MKKVFKIIALYRQGSMRPTTLHLGETTMRGQLQARPTGHWVLGEDRDDALRVARKHRIGNPMGSADIIDWQLCCVMDKEPICENGCRGFEYGRSRGGSVWEEVNGELVKHPTPFERPKS